jgi:hypothetical protein
LPTITGCTNSTATWRASERADGVSPAAISRPPSNCTGPDCLPVFIKITAKDAPGPRTFTAKHADGRTISTTFDVNPNSGRCDYPKGGGK